MTSLTIYRCEQLNKDLEYILSLTPSLIHFKFVSTGTKLDWNGNGHYWQRLIQTNLPLLKKFQFFISYNMLNSQESIPSLDLLITSFQTPFWIEDKRWFVTSDYVMYIRSSRLYTTPVCIDGFHEGQLRCELSSMNTNYRLLGRMSVDGKYIDADEIKVCFSVSEQIGKISICDKMCRFNED